MQTQSIKINCFEKHQNIEGFGCFAGREKDLFRDEARDALLSELLQQLQLSILRTEVKPSFSTAPGERNFDMNANLNIPPNDPYFDSPDQDEVKRRSQLWILKNSCTGSQYNIKKLFASTWSPPYYMKTNLLKRLDPSYYDDFANFLADYIQAYQKINIPFFAVSPQNEPENIYSPWDVCLWLPWETADFVENHMRPIFNDRGLPEIKIMAGECANWSATCIELATMNKKDIDILASHGYSFPNILDNFSVSYNTNPIGNISLNPKQSVWITEGCSTQSFDPSMTMGLQAAICIHKFLSIKNINAYVAWLGMVRGNSNEALICSTGDGNYQLTKAFDVMGNYSRYVKEGYTRVTTNSASLNANVYVSAFMQSNSGNLSIVAINANDVTVPCKIQLSNADNINTLIPYVTPPEIGMRWQQKTTINRLNNQFTFSLPAKSVTTFVSI